MLEKFKKMDRKTKILFEIIAISLIVTLSTTSWAFFSVSGIPQGKDNVITTGTMRLEFADGQEVSAENLTPGHSITKNFKVKNIGNVDTVYNLYLSEVINTFIDKDDLVYSLTSTSTCANVDEVTAPSEAGETIVSNCSISPNIEHEYTLTILFKETDDNQNDNTGKSFSAKISVNDFDVASGIAAVNAYVEEANRFYTLNPSSNELGKNLANSLNVDDKEESDKVLVTHDGKVELAIKRDNHCFRKYAKDNDIKVIDEKLCNANINNFVSNNGQLHVSGTKLLNERGEEVRLTGVGGGDWGTNKYAKEKSVNAQSLASLKSWGGNVYRAFVDSMKSWTTSYIGNEEKYMTMTQELVDAAIANDMYIILNWDPYPEDNNPATSYAVDYFTRVANMYPNDPHVIYEVWNEPTGNTTQSVYSNYMSSVIPAIREISPNAIILASYINGAENLHNNLLPYDNLMYVVHNYMNQFDDDIAGRIQALLDQNIPIFITEWGGMGIGANYRYDGIITHLANEYYKLLNKNNLSYCYFSFGAVEGSSSIQYGIVYQGKWRNDLSDDILTVNGKFLKDILSNNFSFNAAVMKRNHGTKNTKIGDDFTSEEWKNKIEHINFSDTLNVPQDSPITWDLSFSGDGSIIGYLTPSETEGLYTLTIAANGKIYAPQNMGARFAFMSNLKSIDFTNFIVTGVTNLDGVFSYDSKLTALDLSDWDVSGVTSIVNGFTANYQLKSLNLAGWQTGRLLYLQNVFNSCTKLEELDLRGWNVERVKSFSTAFTSMHNLKKLDISNWNPNEVSSINSLLKEDRNLQYVDMRNFNISDSTDFGEAMIRVKEGATIVVKSQEIADILQSVSTNQLNFIIKN